MPSPKADEIVTQQHKRYYYQLNGAAAENEVKYGGLDGDYLTIETQSISLGDITAINVGDPLRYKAFRRVGSEESPPDFDTMTVNFLQHHNGIPRQLYNMRDCVTTFYERTGFCKDPSVFTRKAEDYVKIMANADPTQIEAGGSAFDSDSMVQDNIDFAVLSGVYVVAGLNVGEKAATEVASEVVDVVYGDRVQCGQCGPNDDGTKLIYGVLNNTVASPGVGPSVIYSIDGGDNWTVIAINGATSNDIPKAIEVVGQNLVVVYNDNLAGGYFVSAINSITGAPSTTWTQVTTGFESGNAPNDIYVANPREVYLCGDGGYIYKSESILNGVEAIDPADTTTDNLNRIHGVEATVVAVGDGAAIVYSLNRGDTFALATNAPAAFSLDALWVLDEFRWWVGDSEGDIYWTNTRGETAWTETVLPAAAAGAPATIQNIVFVNDEVGYIVAATSDPAALFFGTINGGYSWEADASTNTFPTMDRVNRVAFPRVPNQSVAANNLAFAGLAGNGTDGILLLGIAPIRG